MFQQLDRAGILALPGLAVLQPVGAGLEPRGAPQIAAERANQAAHVAALLRDHPSVIAFYQGSDDEPDPGEGGASTSRAFRRADWQVPQIASAEYRASRRLGPSGSKEGPYN